MVDSPAAALQQVPQLDWPEGEGVRAQPLASDVLLEAHGQRDPSEPALVDQDQPVSVLELQHEPVMVAAGDLALAGRQVPGHAEVRMSTPSSERSTTRCLPSVRGVEGPAAERASPHRG
jgi:hypothetical protein